MKVIQEQLKEGVIEKAPPISQQKEFYIPHKNVIRETAETTKMRIVYDGCARETPDAPSLNDYLFSGPAAESLPNNPSGRHQEGIFAHPDPRE